MNEIIYLIPDAGQDGLDLVNEYDSAKKVKQKQLNTDLAKSMLTSFHQGCCLDKSKLTLANSFVVALAACNSSSIIVT